MKDYTKFNHEEIEAIAIKYLEGEFIAPKGKESKLWYDYKKAIKKEIYDCKAYLKMAHANNPELSDISKEVQKRLETAQTDLKWVRSIPTFDLEGFCKYWSIASKEYDEYLQPNLIPMMVNRILNGDASDSDKQFVRELLEESNFLDKVLGFRQLTTPVALRNWGKMWNNPSEYYPTETPCDASHLYDHRPHYVYIHSTNVARWGESYWISVDCENILHSLPVIKAFKDYDFEVGKFYKITCTDTLRWGNNKRKYLMEIEESTEEEFLELGLKQYALRW